MAKLARHFLLLASCLIATATCARAQSLIFEDHATYTHEQAEPLQLAAPPEFVMPAFPKGETDGADLYSAGAAGAQRRDTDGTSAQAWQDFTPGNPTAFSGQTFTTGSGTINGGDFNGPLLPVTTTGEIGLQSPLYKPIPSGYYTDGFDMRYCNCQTHLPPTSTASIDFDIVER